MRRALIGTLAGWLTGAVGLVAQESLPPLRDFEEPPTNSRPVQSSHRAPPKSAAKSRIEPITEEDEYPAPRRSARTVVPEYDDRRAPAARRPYPVDEDYRPAAGQRRSPREVPNDDEYRPLPAPRRIPRDVPTDNEYGPAPSPRRAPRDLPFDDEMSPANTLLGPRQPGYGPMPRRTWTPAPMGPEAWGDYDAYGAPAWGCGPDACNSRCPCGPCGPDGRLWLSSELLLWWTRGQYLPPLISTSPPGANGILPGARVLYGDRRVGEDVRPGFRVRAGAWLDECNMCGIEGSFYFLGNRRQTYITPDCVPGQYIGRPFFDVAPINNFGNPRVPGWSAEDICDVDLIGQARIETYSDLYGADANFRRNLVCHSDGRIDLVAGFRYQHVEDWLSIHESLFTLLTAPPGINFIVRDSFRTLNDFYGGQFGLAGEFRSGRVLLDWRTLIAMGPTVHTVQIRGSTTRTIPGNPPTSETRSGGLLALDTNIGDYQTTRFTVIPEIGVNLGYQLTNLLRLFVGYSFLYQSSIVRAGEQVDMNINTTHIPFAPVPRQGPLNPAFRFNYNSYWAQGVSFGLQVRY